MRSLSSNPLLFQQPFCFVPTELDIDFYSHSLSEGGVSAPSDEEGEEDDDSSWSSQLCDEISSISDGGSDRGDDGVSVERDDGGSDKGDEAPVGGLLMLVEFVFDGSSLLRLLPFVILT